MREKRVSLFNRVVEKIKENKKVRLDGGYNCIPWKNLPGLSSVVPGIQKEKYVIVTANSKIGKSQLTDYLFVYEPYEFVKKYKPPNITLKIIYFSLEMSKERKIMSILSYKIFKDKGIIVSPDDLLSVFENRILDDSTEKLLEEYHNYFDEFEETVEIIDNIRNPFGIFKYVSDYHEQNGKWEYKEIDWINEDGKVIKKNIKSRYIPNNPEEIVIVIVDNYNVMLPEKGQTLFDAIHKFSSDYALILRDKYKDCVVGVQQQAAGQEQQQYTFSGNSIVDKLKPSPDGLGDCKLVGRDCNLMLGLFGPARYKIKTHEGYNTERLGDHYRELLVIFNRDGSGSCSDHLLFHGAVNYFRELPAKMGEEDYKKIEKEFKLR